MIALAAAKEEMRKAEAENRRKLAQAERQMARVREIIRKRRMKDVRHKERQNIVKQQAALAEADRRFWTMNRRFIRVVWNNWKLQVIISKNKINKFKFTLMKMISGWRRLATLTGEKVRNCEERSDEHQEHSKLTRRLTHRASPSPC